MYTCLLRALVLLSTTPGLFATAVAAEPPGTMRVDYVHTGGQGLEVFSLDEIVIEPLPFPGHPSQVSDDPLSGNYRFELRDNAGHLLYTRGFSSIFAEWVLTREATESHRSFHESLRFPTPAVAAQLSVLRRNEGQSFDTVWSIAIDPAGMFVDDSAPPRPQLIAIQNSGPPERKLDLLLIGDGYMQPECAGRFEPQARELTAALFEKEPFKSRRNDINVWALCPPAMSSGISRPSTGQHRRSPVGATYDAFGSERYILTFDNKALRDLAAWAPYEFLVILANNDTYGGGGIHNAFATVAAGSEWAPYVFVHELGHHFAALADEYYTSPVAYEPAQVVIEPWEPNVTALKTPDRVKWQHLITAGTSVPTTWPKQLFEEHQRDFQARRKQIRAANRPESEMNALFREEQAFTTALLARSPEAGKVGAFQGANYDAEAFYRPQLDCVMFTRDEVPFCRVCQYALDQVINLYTTAPD